MMIVGQVLFICLALLKTATSTPQLHVASDGREYLIETELQYNWYQAWHECARRDFQLLTIDSEDKNNVVIGLLENVIGQPHNLWLGGSDNFSNGDCQRPFFWSSTGKAFTFTYWSDFNPDNAKQAEHCVHIWNEEPQYQWNDGECTEKMGFICEANTYYNRYSKNRNNVTAAIEQANENQQLYRNAAQSAIQQTIKDQEHAFNQLKNQILNQVNVLSADLRQFALDINKSADKLNRIQ